jgi:hypothetical protein
MLRKVLFQLVCVGSASCVVFTNLDPKVENVSSRVTSNSGSSEDLAVLLSSAGLAGSASLTNSTGLYLKGNRFHEFLAYFQEP